MDKEDAIAHRLTKEIVEGPECWDDIHDKGDQIAGYKVKENAQQRGIAYAHFDMIAESKDLMNLCYTAAMASYIHYKHAGENGHIVSPSLRYTLSMAQTSMDSWKQYWMALYDAMTDMPDGWDAGKVVRHEKYLAMDKHNTLKFMKYFADKSYKNFNDASAWYPARKSPGDMSCRGWYEGVNNRGMCRKCEREGRGCYEFRKVGDWGYGLEPPESWMGSRWLLASFELCVEGGHVWLPQGDTKNCNFYKNSPGPQGGYSWQREGELLQADPAVSELELTNAGVKAVQEG